MDETIKELLEMKDGRPDNVCQKCGYHVCCCKLQNPVKFKKVDILVLQTEFIAKIEKL